MIVDRHEPVNLFALIPERYAHFEPQLQELDRLQYVRRQGHSSLRNTRSD